MSTQTITVRARCQILFVAAICASPAALCQDDSVPTGRGRSAPFPEYIQEFFFSDAVRNQDKGEVQITSGLATMQRAGTNILLKMEYGVTQRLEFNIEVPEGITEGESGQGPDRFRTANLGVQYQLIRRDAPIALALGMAFGVPLRSGGEVEYEPMLLAAKSFRKLQVHGSIGADLEESKASLQYNLGSVYPIHRAWFPTLEFNVRRHQGQDMYYLTPGIYRRLLPRLEFGIGVPMGLSGTVGRAGIVGKLTWEIGGEHEPE